MFTNVAYLHNSLNDMVDTSKSLVVTSCGYKNPLVKNLAVRVWGCPKCHTVHNRDTNASINILNKGLQMQSA